MTNADAEQALNGTFAADKNEILFSRFGINYNNEPQIFRKGTVIYRSYDADTTAENRGDGCQNAGSERVAPQSKTQLEKERKRKLKATIAVEHIDIIGDAFWNAHSFILAGRQVELDEE